MKEYYILSIKRTDGYVLTWYRPKALGYTIYLNVAGKFTEEEIEAKKSSFDNKKDTIAVPCDLADAASYSCVPWEGKCLEAMGVSGAFKNS